MDVTDKGPSRRKAVYERGDRFVELPGRDSALIGIVRFRFGRRRVQDGVDDVLVGEGVEVAWGGDLLEVEGAAGSGGFPLGLLIVVAWGSVRWCGLEMWMGLG